jgi:hypothetical protein
VSPAAEAVPGEPEVRLGDRVAAAFLFVLMAVGSLVLWTAIPVACLWIAGKLTESIATHFLIALPLTVTCVGLFAALLFRLNQLYLRVTGTLLNLRDDEEDEEEEPRIPRGPLEPMLVGSLAIALAALVVWFFFFAEDPPRHVI